jgi:hypothetical protein
MSAQNIFIACSGVASLMHGAAGFTLPLKRGRLLTVTYSDGSKESAKVSKETAELVRAVYRYCNEGGPFAELNTFALVSEVQAQRKEVSQC